MDLFSSEPRGFRNNNPLNLRYSPYSRWKGLAGNDEGFCIFKTPALGFRAAYLHILNISKKSQSPLTIEGLIHNLCPSDRSFDYISKVCSFTGLYPSHVLDLHYSPYMASLLMAMCKYENGSCPYNKSTIQHIIEIAERL